VTPLLGRLLETEAIDAVVVSRRRSAFLGQSVLATTPARAAEAAGNVYDQSFSLALLAGSWPKGLTFIALVGSPSQVSPLQALTRFPWPYRVSSSEDLRASAGRERAPVSPPVFRSYHDRISA